MKNSIIIRVVIFGAIAIIGIIALQVHLMERTWDEREQEFHEKVVIALDNVAHSFERMGSSLPSYDYIKQVSSNYYVVNINDIIEPNNLDFFLRKEFEGIHEDFEYRIYDCETQKMVYGKEIFYSKDTMPVAQAKFPVLKEFEYYFGVRFPNRSSEILSSMRLEIIFASILFLTILFFIYTTSVILRQKRLSEMQKDFINNMTHEFKTPISTIKISADVFLKNELIRGEKRLFQYANIIKEQNQRLNHQVEKVLQLARIERDNFQLNMEKIDFHQLLHENLDSARMKVEMAGGTIDFSLNAKHPIFSADKTHLTNIFFNLLDNAIKYCQVNPRIVVSTTDLKEGMMLQIKDNGIGIEEEHLPKVFNKFYRVPTGNVHNVKGFGLGLFYIKNICEAHGWKVNIESKKEQGSVVSIHVKQPKTFFNALNWKRKEPIAHSSDLPLSLENNKPI